ncbi:MAG TPA: hypothetical protein VIX73_33060 [Kofleriaceae bacterium]
MTDTTQGIIIHWNIDERVRRSCEPAILPIMSINEEEDYDESQDEDQGRPGLGSRPGLSSAAVGRRGRDCHDRLTRRASRIVNDQAALPICGHGDSARATVRHVARVVDLSIAVERPGHGTSDGGAQSAAAGVAAGAAGPGSRGQQ